MISIRAFSFGNFSSEKIIMTTTAKNDWARTVNLCWFFNCTVRLLTNGLCKPTHFFFRSSIASMSYSFHTRFNSVSLFPVLFFSMKFPTTYAFVATQGLREWLMLSYQTFITFPNLSVLTPCCFINFCHLIKPLSSYQTSVIPLLSIHFLRYLLIL